MKKNQRKSGALLSYISIIVNTLVQLVYTPFLISKLGQSEYGLYSLMNSIIGYLTVLDLGFGNAIIVYTAKYRALKKVDEEKKLHGMFKIIFLLIGVLAAIIGLILFFNVDNMFGKTMSIEELKSAKVMMLILSFNLFITFKYNIYSAIISAYERFTFQKIVSIINTLLKPLLMIPLLLLGYKAITMTIVLTIVNIIVCLSNYIYCKKNMKLNIKFSGFNKSLFKTILGYSIWIFIGSIVDKANWSVDNFVLGAVSGTIAVSIYSIAATLNQMFVNLSTAISGVLLPKMSKLVANKASSEELTNELIKIGRLQNYVIFLMCSGLILFGKKFIIMWAGEGFEESYYVSLLLIIPVCVPLIQNLGLSIMQAMNKFRFKSISSAIMAIINVVISVFFAKKMGAIGAALGTCISLVICNIIIINIYYYKELKLNIIKFWISIIKQSIPFCIPIAIMAVMINFRSIQNLKELICYGILYTSMFCIISYLLSMNEYEKNLIKNILKKFPIKKVKIWKK